MNEVPSMLHGSHSPPSSSFKNTIQSVEYIQYIVKIAEERGALQGKKTEELKVHATLLGIN